MSHSTNKLRRGNLLCCFSENFWYRKNSWIREGEGRERVLRFSVKNFLSNSAEKVRRGTLQCFRKFLLLENVNEKRGGGYHNFLSKLFCLTVPNHFVE